MKLQTAGNAVFSLCYHLISVVKYRRKAFVNPKIVDRFKEILLDLAQQSGVEIKEMECGSDHAHIVFSCKPTLDLTKWINSVKGVTARYLRKGFPELKGILCGEHFWSPSYFLATTGNVSLDILEGYVEGQRVKEGLDATSVQVPALPDA
jgi:putative transposase